ncbi:hypothetical protein C8R45DRAFT_1212437 [Mycena sanguinolenta]|nr:hypothetical protein C8R45DRAFT_1212437 [Mycena sanguinolenta]
MPFPPLGPPAAPHFARFSDILLGVVTWTLVDACMSGSDPVCPRRPPFLFSALNALAPAWHLLQPSPHTGTAFHALPLPSTRTYLASVTVAAASVTPPLPLPPSPRRQTGTVHVPVVLFIPVLLQFGVLSFGALSECLIFFLGCAWTLFRPPTSISCHANKGRLAQPVAAGNLPGNRHHAAKLLWVRSRA